MILDIHIYYFLGIVTGYLIKWNIDIIRRNDISDRIFRRKK